MEGLGPFGLAGFGRIWGYVGLCRLVGALPGDRNVARGHAKRGRNGGPLLRRTTNGLHVIRSPVRLVHCCFLAAAWLCAATLLVAECPHCYACALCWMVLVVTTGAWPACRHVRRGEGVSNLWERFVGDRAALSCEFSRNSRPGVFAQKARISKEKWGVDGQ